MKKHTSLYLDLLRVFAAMAVFLSHLTRNSLSAGNPALLSLGQFGQEGVAIFFVISGVVIASVARGREQNFRTYLVGRLGRLWSVMLPALVLTIILDTLGRAISPAMYAESGIQPWGWTLRSLWNFLGPAFFLNQVSFASADPGTNGPFWSLCYEFWYYMIFGIAYYLRGFWRIVLIAGAAAIAGIPILSLLPIWALGLIVYINLGRKTTLQSPVLVWLISLLAMISLMLFKYKIASFISNSLPSLNLNALATVSYISHFAIGLICALNITIFDRACAGFGSRMAIADRWIRFLAARSFSLYLYQAPLLFFFGAITFSMKSPGQRISIIILATLTSILLLAELTETRKKWFVSLAEKLVPEFRYGLGAHAFVANEPKKVDR